MTKAQAKRKLKSHVQNKGSKCDFEVTPHFVLHWWHLLNKAIFDNELTPPRRIEIRAFRGAAGWCEGCAPVRQDCDDVIMGIKKTQTNRATFLWVLAHEMVHQWEWAELKAMSHGESFMWWSDKVEEITGAPLSETEPTL